MNRKYFTDLADYLLWANNIAIGWLNQIDDQQWEQVISSSFGSVKQTAIHMVSAEKIWLDYWKKVPDPIFLSMEFKGSKSELIATWKKPSADLKNFIEKYPEENYCKPITFRWPRGGEGTMEFWQTFSHMINHFSYHRGQLVTLLRHTGFTKFTSTDLATYWMILKSQQ